MTRPSARRVHRAVHGTVSASTPGRRRLDRTATLLTTVVLIVLAAVFTGGALAFGLGGRAWVANVLSAHYVGRLYQVGQTIRVGRVEGKILRFTDTAVILESRDGETAVPASEFAAMPSTLLLKRGQAKDTSAKAPATEELGS